MPNINHHFHGSEYLMILMFIFRKLSPQDIGSRKINMIMFYLLLHHYIPHFFNQNIAYMFHSSSFLLSRHASHASLQGHIRRKLQCTYGEGNGNPLQYSCREGPMDGGAWQAAVHRIARSRTWLHFHLSLSCIGEGNGNPLQCSCLENPRDGRAKWAAIYGVSQSRAQLKRLSRSSSSSEVINRKFLA